MRRRTDAGETLVEVLITLVLVGIGVSAVLTALMTGIRGSRSTQSTTDARAVLVAAAEQVEAATYVPCAGLTGYNASLASPAAPRNNDGTNVSASSVSVSAISYWSTTAGGAQGFSATDCSYENTAGAISRLQRLTLQSSSSDEMLTIIKRAP